MRKIILSALVIPVAMNSIGHAAQSVDLSQDPSVILQKYAQARHFTPSPLTNQPAVDIKELRQETDLNQNTHIRVQQTYLGYPVWGGDAIIHKPAQTTWRQLATSKATADGIFYQQLEHDLKEPPSVLNKNQGQAKVESLQITKQIYGDHINVVSMSIEPIIYVDDFNKAHYAFHISYVLFSQSNPQPSEPHYILDAQNFQVYKNWNNVKTITVEAGGLGGNKKKHWLYDGSVGNLSRLQVERDHNKQICLLKNNKVTVFDYKKFNMTEKLENSLIKNYAVSSFPCVETSERHHNIYWNGSFDMTNGGYSPGNDALFAGDVIQKMYLNWYGIEMLTQEGLNGKKIPMVLKMIAHVADPRTHEYENASWVPYYNAMFLGAGGHSFYPLTSVGIIAHEVSHGFTTQHANLNYTNQSGAVNESFSDMAAQAAEQYAYGRMSGFIGEEVAKEKNAPLRYLAKPTDDCQGNRPGDNCSIDHVTQYAYLVQRSYYYTEDIRNPREREIERQNYIVHHASGIFNRVFYSVATSPEWDAKKTFAVMVQANRFYWTENATYHQAACGVMKATRDLHYDATPFVKAFNAVGIDVKFC